MFPEETHVKILQQLDALESDAYGVYRRAESLRLNLQQQWKALPSGERWTKEKHEASAHSSKSAAPAPRET